MEAPRGTYSSVTEGISVLLIKKEGFHKPSKSLLFDSAQFPGACFRSARFCFFI